jgi:hypothetical protein
VSQGRELAVCALDGDATLSAATSTSSADPGVFVIPRSQKLGQSSPRAVRRSGQHPLNFSPPPGGPAYPHTAQKAASAGYLKGGAAFRGDYARERGHNSDGARWRASRSCAPSNADIASLKHAFARRLDQDFETCHRPKRFQPRSTRGAPPLHPCDSTMSNKRLVPTGKAPHQALPPSPWRLPGASRRLETGGKVHQNPTTQHAAAAAAVPIRHQHGIGQVGTDERNSSAGPAPLSLASPRGAQTSSNLLGDHQDPPTQPRMGAAAGAMAPHRVLVGVGTDGMASSESAPAPKRKPKPAILRRTPAFP